MENIKVENVIISKQVENSENFEEFLRIAKDKKLKVRLVEVGKRLNIEEDLYFDILFPDSNDLISDNALNNNSIVCKLVYKSFSMLFTGDIEAVAEKKIAQMYKDTNILQSTVLKVAHHGSKTSSIQEFLELVKPKIALIGVSANNTFGHPNDEVLDRLIDLRGKSI